MKRMEGKGGGDNMKTVSSQYGNFYIGVTTINGGSWADDELRVMSSTNMHCENQIYPLKFKSKYCECF